MNLSNFFYRNSRLLGLTVCLIIVAGLSSYFVLPRMEDPKLVERGAFVNTLFPGADPQRIESLVSEKIEDAIIEIEEIKELRSTSREGISTVSIELRDDVLDAEPVWSRIRDKIDDISGELPPGAFPPEFEEMDFKAYALLVALKWDSDEPTNFSVLRRLAIELKDRMQDVSGTEKAELIGDVQEEILVTLNPAQLVALSLTVDQISDQIRNSDSKVAAGQIRGEQNEYLLQVAGEFKSIQRIENIPIRFGEEQSFVPLRDIARVEKTIQTPAQSLAIIDGKRSIVIGSFVRPGARIDQWSDLVSESLRKFEDRLPRGVALDRIYSQNSYVSARLNVLLTNLLIGSIAVFFVIFFIMGFRNAVVVSLALPLSAMMVLFGMKCLDTPIHQMSVTGMIIALGLLIDNGIVIVDEISMKMKLGMKAADAVGKSVKHLFLPLLGSTLTTAFAFGPIALMPGPAGEFVGSIATNVIVAIFSSFFLAMTVLPAIAAMISPFRNVTSEDEAEELLKTSKWWTIGWSNPTLSGHYNRMLTFVFARPWIGLLIGIIFTIAGMFAATSLKEQFFPPADRDQLHIELELSPTASIEGTLESATSMTEFLLAQPEIRRVDWFVGESAPAFYYNLIPRRSNVSQYAQALVQLKSSDQMKVLIHRLQDRLDSKFADARVLVRQLEQGPPFDAPVEVRLFGPDLQELQRLGGHVRRVLTQTPGVIHTRGELDEVLPKIDFKINEESAQRSGLNLTQMARQLESLTAGSVGGSTIEATEDLPVRVRLARSQSNSLNNISDLDFISLAASRNFNGKQSYSGIPLSAVSETRLLPSYGSINHFNGRRMNEIQVYIPAGVLPSTVLSEFKKQMTASGFEMPENYEISFGGEAAKRDEAIGNLISNVGILLVLMIATLVLSFGSFRIAMIIGVVAMLSMGLGMGALWIFGFPFGFMAIVGTMGLMGVAINDTIVVLAAIQGDPAARTGDRQALQRVVNNSTRHIISTSLTTMAGFTPLIIGGGGFWPPLAISIAGGVGGATILALIFVPSCYLMMMCRKSHRVVGTQSELELHRSGTGMDPD